MHYCKWNRLVSQTRTFLNHLRHSILHGWWFPWAWPIESFVSTLSDSTEDWTASWFGIFLTRSSNRPLAHRMQTRIHRRCTVGAPWKAVP
eukprot:1168100-Prymnesium_polylepis.2